MCQAYESEKAFILASEDRCTVQGYRAHRDGFTCEANPYDMHRKYYHEAWDVGWQSRASGTVPYAVLKIWREKQESVTGRSNYDRITIEQADTLV